MIRALTRIVSFFKKKEQKQPHINIDVNQLMRDIRRFFIINTTLRAYTLQVIYTHEDKELLRNEFKAAPRQRGQVPFFTAGVLHVYVENEHVSIVLDEPHVNAYVYLSEREGKLFLRGMRDKEYPQEEEYMRNLFRSAVGNDQESIYKALAENPNILNYTDSKGFSLISLAAYEGHYALVSYMLQCCPHVSQELKDHALYASAQQGHPKLVKLLLSYGAKVGLTDDNGATCLHHAVLNDDCSIVELLLKAGSPLNIKTDEGWTEIFPAISNQNLPMVSLLLAYGADIEYMCHKYGTALQYACTVGDAAIIERLRDTQKGETCLH